MRKPVQIIREKKAFDKWQSRASQRVTLNCFNIRLETTNVIQWISAYIYFLILMSYIIIVLYAMQFDSYPLNYLYIYHTEKGYFSKLDFAYDLF